MNARSSNAERAWTLTAFVVLAAAIAAAFAPAFGAGFVDLDDPANLVDNPRWRGFTAENAAWMLTAPHMGHWHPLTWASFALDHALHGDGAAALHTTNVVLHALGACVLFLLARRVLLPLLPATTERARAALALAAAAAWALHPLRVESVAWLTERRDVLSALFWFACVLAWTRYVDAGRRRGAYAWPLAFAALSLLAKAWGMTLCVVLLLVDVAVLRRREAPERASWRTLLVEKLPFLLLGLAAAALALWAQSAAGSTLQALDRHGPIERAAQAAFGACWYVAKTVAPAGLRPMVALPEPFEWKAPVFLGSMAIAVIATVLAVRALLRSSPAAAAWLAFLAVLAPVSGATQAGLQLVADRYAHLSTVPLFLAWAVLLARLARSSRTVALLLGAGVPLALGFATHERARAWRSTEELWTAVLALDPTDPFACSSLAAARDRAALSAAAPETKRALLQEGLAFAHRGRARSDWPQLAFNTGVLLEHLSALDAEHRVDLLEAALAEHERGFELAQAAGQLDPEWHMARAAVLFQLERIEAALPDLEAFARLRPGDARGHRSLALALARLGRLDAAADEYARAAELAPDDAGLALRLGRVLEALGRREAARAAFSEAMERVARGSRLPPSELDEARAAVARLGG